MIHNNFKILIVDDDIDILEFIGYNLRKEGFEVFEAKNGKEAIESAKKKKCSFNFNGCYDA